MHTDLSAKVHCHYQHQTWLWFIVSLHFSLWLMHKHHVKINCRGNKCLGIVTNTYGGFVLDTEGLKWQRKSRCTTLGSSISCLSLTHTDTHTHPHTHTRACWMITSCVKFSRSGFRTVAHDTKSSLPRAASPRVLHCPGCPHLCQTIFPTRPSVVWTSHISWLCADTWTVSVRWVGPHRLLQEIWPILNIICRNTTINTLDYWFCDTRGLTQVICKPLEPIVSTHLRYH